MWPLLGQGLLAGKSGHDSQSFPRRHIPINKYLFGFAPTIGSTALPGGQTPGSATGEPGRKPPSSPWQNEWNVGGGGLMLGTFLSVLLP